MNRKFTSGQLKQIGKIAMDVMTSLNLNFEAAQRLVSNPQLSSRLKTLFESLSVLGHQVTYDQSIGLRKLIELAVGPTNLCNINRDITQERFPLSGNGVHKLNLRVLPYLGNESSEEAAVRLVADGHTLANTGDLAGFLHDHPTEVEKWAWVHAISEDSRWTVSDGNVFVPCAHMFGAIRYFFMHDFRLRLSSHCGVLVVCD
jgi:hypothetical protein